MQEIATIPGREGAAAAVEAQINRFRRTFRRRMRKLARGAPAFADLVVAFPAAAFVLAIHQDRIAERAAAARLVKAGKPLKQVAKALELPMWTRKLPPEAFMEPLPALPRDPAFNERVGGFVPEKAYLTANWLDWVLQAERFAGPQFALWLARLPVFTLVACHREAVLPLALFAWFSSQPQTAAGRLIERRWNEKMSMPRAVDAAFAWFEALQSEFYLGADPVAQTWVSGGRAAGFRFVPLMTKADLEEEAEAMTNCADTYAIPVGRGDCRLFSIRRGGRRVATLEIRPHQLHPGIPTIVQLYGPYNAPADHTVWKAAFQWLGKQSRFEVPKEFNRGPVVPNERAWQRLFRPFWLARGMPEFLPMVPDASSVALLTERLDQLGRRGH